MAGVGPGVPGWVDFGSSDFEASTAFYGALFGWEAGPPSPEFGGYTIFTLDGRAVAGGAPLMSPEQPTAWSTYVIVEDAAATTSRVALAGGRVLVEPMAVSDQGTMGVYVDPSGAAIGVWQPGEMKGGEVFNEPGSLTWNDLMTDDVEAAKAFYGTVFGWDAVDSDSRWELDGRQVAGVSPVEDSPQWAVTFSVTDCDAAAALIPVLGGTVLVPPADAPPGGRVARAMDPGGARFAMISFSD
jgi:predicted enzyme related to lactoylglutathione lyase